MKHSVCVLSDLVFFSLPTAPYVLDREDGQLTESVPPQV